MPLKGSTRVPLRVPKRDLKLGFRGLQYLLINEYSLNHIRDPTIF